MDGDHVGIQITIFAQDPQIFMIRRKCVYLSIV